MVGVVGHTIVQTWNKYVSYGEVVVLGYPIQDYQHKFLWENLEWDSPCKYFPPFLPYLSF